MQNSRFLTRIDFTMQLVIFCLMAISIATLHSYSQDGPTVLWTPIVKQQLLWFALGSVLYFVLIMCDYNKLREWTWGTYLLMLLSLVGLFFVEPIQNVHRWYKIPLLNVSIQPSEYAKLITVMSLAWFLERAGKNVGKLSTAFFSSLIVFIPFVLILKQPDLGTSLVLVPMTLAMFYIARAHKVVVTIFSYVFLISLTFLALKFTGCIDHEAFRPYALQFLKEYQYERLNPESHHQMASLCAIALGGFLGQGKSNSEFVAKGFLPAATTDSVFPAFGEEFGFLGLFVLITLYFLLIQCACRVASHAKTPFGTLLASGITVYLAVHILINIGMMLAFLPITGVPLPMITYGGSCVLSTFAALGILQSIHARRFMF